MLMSIDACYKCWMPSLTKSLGKERAKLACDVMRPVIERARKAESEGRISDMQPIMATVNTSETVDQGYWYLEIRFCPIVDGEKLPRTSWKTTILKPQEEALAD
jgi:hypothetical protein